MHKGLGHGMTAMALHAIGMHNYKKGRDDEFPHAQVRFNALQAATVSAPSQIALYATGSPAFTSQWPGTQTQVAFNGAHESFVVAPAQMGLYMGGSPSISAHFPDSGGSHPPGQAPHVRKSALYEHAWVWSSFRLDSTELPPAWHLKVIVTSRCPDAVWQLAPRSPFAQKPTNPFVGSCVSTMEKVPPAEVSGSNQCMMTPRQTAGFLDSSNWINEPTCAMPLRMHVRGVSTHGVNVNDWSAAVFWKV